MIGGSSNNNRINNWGANNTSGGREA
jgi:hypothetical protein